MKGNAIQEAIQNVQKELAKNPIGKDKKNTYQNYNYRGIDQVYETFSKLFRENKIVTNLLPATEESGPIVSSFFLEDKKTGFSSVQGTLRMLSLEDGSFVDTAYLGQSKSTQGKDLAAARSFAYRDALLQFFCVPFEGTQEPETVGNTKPAVLAVGNGQGPGEESRVALEEFTKEIKAATSAEAKKVIFASYQKIARQVNNPDLERGLVVAWAKSAQEGS